MSPALFAFLLLACRPGVEALRKGQKTAEASQIVMEANESNANPRCGTQNCCRSGCGVIDRNSQLRCNGEQCMEDRTCCSGCCIAGMYRCSGQGDRFVTCRGNAPFPEPTPTCSSALQRQADQAAGTCCNTPGGSNCEALAQFFRRSGCRFNFNCR